MLDDDQADVFDLDAKRMKARPTLEWQSRFFEQIIERCLRYHGTAFDAYMLALIAAGEDAITSARADQEAFIRKVVGPFDGAEARDLAMKFGIVYAGSCRAVEYGIVAWSREEALNAAKAVTGAPAPCCRTMAFSFKMDSNGCVGHSSAFRLSVSTKSNASRLKVLSGFANVTRTFAVALSPSRRWPPASRLCGSSSLSLNGAPTTSA